MLACSNDVPLVHSKGLCISNSPHIKGKRPVSQRSRKNPSSAASSLTTLSSTPHAPRQKKPIPFLPQQRHGSLGHLPSTHSLIKQHRYLDEGLLRSLSSPSLAPRRRDPSKGQKEGDKPTEQDGGGGSVEGQGLREAWGEKCGASSVREVSGSVNIHVYMYSCTPTFKNTCIIMSASLVPRPSRVRRRPGYEATCTCTCLQ